MPCFARLSKAVCVHQKSCKPCKQAACFGMSKSRACAQLLARLRKSSTSHPCAVVLSGPTGNWAELLYRPMKPHK